jgi:hypothetical protein
MADRNKDFIKDDPGMGKGAVILLILATLVIFGGLAYFLINHGETLSLPKIPK